MEEAYCEMIEDACDICAEGENIEEVQDLLRGIERCQVRGGSGLEGFDEFTDPYDDAPFAY